MARGEIVAMGGGSSYLGGRTHRVPGGGEVGLWAQREGKWNSSPVIQQC